MPIEMLEVGPRDGLQNEAVALSTADKIKLICQLEAAGARRIEVASFVNPHKVPNMADAEAVIAGLPSNPAGRRIGLVLNRRGAERALATSIDELGAVVVASDRFGIANQGQDRAASLAVACEIIALARSAGRRAQATIAVAFGCPYEGAVDEDAIVDAARAIAAAGAHEVALADTIGVGVPADVERLLPRVRDAVAPLPVRVHFHDTRGTGIANVWAAIRLGATTVDSSVGGLGGCPFAPGAAGNVATERVAYLLDRSGIASGFDHAQLRQASAWLDERLGRSMRSGEPPSERNTV